jgi:hypothetical protein
MTPVRAGSLVFSHEARPSDLRSGDSLRLKIKNPTLGVGLMFVIGAEGRTRTGTSSRPPPPQDGVSTRFHHFGTQNSLSIEALFVKRK